MASRTYHAIGPGLDLWIELEDGTIVLTYRNGKPHGVARDKNDAAAVFNAERGPAADRTGANQTVVSFDQTFPAHVLKNMIHASNEAHRGGKPMPPPP